jgi:hypothetical protein
MDFMSNKIVIGLLATVAVVGIYFIGSDIAVK